jgi:hypothetical protein
MRWKEQQMCLFTKIVSASGGTYVYKINNSEHVCWLICTFIIFQTLSPNTAIDVIEISCMYWWDDWSCRWDVTSINCGHQWVYCSSPWWYIYLSMENHCGMMSTGEIPDLSTTALSRNRIAEPSSSKIQIRRILAKEMMNFVYEVSLSYS